VDGTALADAASRRAYGTVVVVGGGCYGSYYVRQLQRACARHALRIERLIVVDRDPHCTVATPREDDASGLRPELQVGAWDDFFDGYLRTAGDTDAIVPSPLMPHLFLHWLARRVGERQPGRRVELLAPGALDGIPWQREGTGARYVSFAEWMCPVNCIEPTRCPHTRSERTWSLPVALRRAPARAGTAEAPRVAWDAAALLHCTHRAYGVGMIDATDVLAADTLVSDASARGPARVLVGSVSHCHGALGIIALT
jgi:hypothetical protein